MFYLQRKLKKYKQQQSNENLQNCYMGFVYFCYLHLELSLYLVNLYYRTILAFIFNNYQGCDVFLYSRFEEVD